MRIQSLLAAALLASTTAMAGAALPAFPLKQSANNRYLVDQNDVPFLTSFPYAPSPHQGYLVPHP